MFWFSDVMDGTWTVKIRSGRFYHVSYIHEKISFVRLFERLRCFLVVAGLDLNQQPPCYEGLNFLKTLRKSYKTNTTLHC